jgi:hypothetical protein
MNFSLFTRFAFHMYVGETWTSGGTSKRCGESGLNFCCFIFDFCHRLRCRFLLILPCFGSLFRIPAVKRKLQATANDQWMMKRMRAKLRRQILADQVMIEVVNRFDIQAKLLSFMGTSHSKLGELGDLLERAGRPPSEVDEIISFCDRQLRNLKRSKRNVSLSVDVPVI